jgi:polyhydroxybutyrate depolymerase
LFAFHGGFGTADSYELSSRFSEYADQRGFVVVYGQGTGQNPVWNAGGCCGSAMASRENIDDVGYARNVLSQIKTKYNINNREVYAAGMSNGSMFTNRLACEASDVFAGAATVSGTIQVPVCNPTKRMPMLIVHGTADSRIPYYGGTGTVLTSSSTFIPVEQEFADWGKRDGCLGATSTVRIPSLDSADSKTVDRITFQSCGKPVELYRINGGEHEWPGASSATKVFNASETILNFFGL